jgi:hypothetical protein
MIFVHNSDVSLLCLPVGEGSCDEAAITVPTTVIVVEQSACSVVVESVRRASWAWRGTEVPVLGEVEDWKGEVLRKAVILCMVKLTRGESVRICGSESVGVCGSKENIVDIIWFVYFFGEESRKGPVIWYDDTWDSDGRGRVVRKKVTVEMFLWALNIGLISERTLCEGLPKFGPFLFRVLKTCFGVGLVDKDITALVRCVLIYDDVCVIVLFNMLCCLSHA